MFAAFKVIIAAGVACGTLIASIVEIPYPRFAACFWAAFTLGAIAAELIRARRQRSIRWPARKTVVQ
jgi:hydroxyethylthiazole kinase-like sugar kinase family protein